MSNKAHPILFSTPMVQAIMEGRKTQTRRVVKPQPSDNWMQNVFSLCPTYNMYRSNGEQMFWLSDGKDDEIKCPYGKPRDLLWVRETSIINKNSCRRFFVADGYHKSISEETGKPFPYEKVVPSIFMPKMAARIWLEITNIKVERLQDISAADAINEGVNFYDDDVIGRCYKDYMGDASGYGNSDVDFHTTHNPITSFQTLWQSINGEESWNANPWVWAIEFKTTK